MYVCMSHRHGKTAGPRSVPLHTDPPWPRDGFYIFLFFFDWSGLLMRLDGEGRGKGMGKEGRGC